VIGHPLETVSKLPAGLPAGARRAVLTGVTTPTDEAWKPTQEEVQRALEAGVIHLSVPVRGAACSHNNSSLHECPECRKAILDYERQQGREPTSPDAKWKSTRYEWMRAFDAGVIKHHPKAGDGRTVCSHDRFEWEDCPECQKAILDYERQQGREPTDPEAWRTDRAKEIEEEEERARKAFVAALGPQEKGWHVWLRTSISMGIVWVFADYVSLGAGIAMATFCIIKTLHDLAEIEGARRLAFHQAQRDVDEWHHIHSQFLRAP
jgi:hypothetical protein